MLFNTYIAHKYLQDLIYSILPLLITYHMELHSVLCGSLGGRGVREKMDLCIYTAESPSLFTRNYHNIVG